MPSFPHCRRIVIASLAAVLAMGGCAVQKAQNGQIQFQVDDAEIFGQVTQTFRMPDGSEGRLRLLAGRYSVKLQKQLTVIPVNDALMAEVRSVHQVGGRSLIVLSKRIPQCGHQMQLIAIQGIEALSWDFGDCSRSPDTRVYANNATFDFRQDNGSTIRFTYQDGRLMRGSYAGAPPGAPPVAAGPVLPGAARHIPGPPAAPVAGDRPNGTTTPGPARMASAEYRPAKAPSAQATRPAAAPAPAKVLDFPAQEQKPVRIILDK